MDQKEKLVSIIMPTFNAECYLREAINSILNQTYHNLELLVIDDKSTDSTIGILTDYEKLDNRVKIIRGLCRGIASALNMGIDMASGEYIARMDADDISALNRIEEQIAFMESHSDIGVCSTQIQLMKEDGSYQNIQKYPVESDNIRLSLLNYCSIAHPTVMFRSQVVKNKWKYNIMPAEDYDLWTRMAVSEKFACIPKVLLYYRIHSDSASMMSGRLIMLFINNQIIKSYMKNLFDIDVFHYEANDFFVMDDTALFEETVQGYLFRQLQLLKEIDVKNEERSIFRKEIMEEFLCQRWNLVWKEIEMDERIIGGERLQHFSELQTKSDCEVKKILDESFEKLRILFRQSKKFVIYGLGNLGKKLLEDWERMKKSDQIKWELIALCDKNKESVDIEENLFLINKPNMLVSLEFDYMIISSKVYYEEIKSELLAIGIEEKNLVWWKFV